MKIKKQASEKPIDMSDELWAIFMAHKGDNTHDVSNPRIGEGGTVVYAHGASTADVADHLAEVHARKTTMKGVDYEKSRQERLARGKEGGV